MVFKKFFISICIFLLFFQFSLAGEIKIESNNVEQFETYDKNIFLNDFTEDSFFFGVNFGEKYVYNDIYQVYLNDILLEEGQLGVSKKTLSVGKKVNYNLSDYRIYHFIIKILDNNSNVKGSKRFNLYHYNNLKINDLDIKYIYKDGYTIFNVLIDRSGIFKVEIPKKILKEINNTNFDSSLEYEIINKDPLIAWNIDEPPKKIDFKIKGEIPEEEIEDIKPSVETNSFFKYILIFGIISLLTIIFYNIYESKKSK